MVDSNSNFMVLLIIITVSLYLIPFVPALFEWKKRTDSDPLSIRFNDKTIVEYNLRLFRDLIKSNFLLLINDHIKASTNYSGINEKGVNFYIKGKVGDFNLAESEIDLNKEGSVILLGRQTNLPDEMVYNNKIYSKDILHIGKMNTLKDVYAEGNIIVDSYTTIDNLLYSASSILIHDHCKLVRFAQANETIRLDGEGTIFHYLYAPRVGFGDASVLNEQLPPVATNIFARAIEREVIYSNFTIPSAGELNKHYVVRGNLTIESGAIINGSIKAHKDIFIGENVTIGGSIFCKENIYISNNCVIQGPIVGDRALVIGRGCKFGSMDTRTSIIAKRITVSPNSVFSGLLFAKVEGLYKSE